jgi:NADPH:quinone reductase-like Zn-dependent oxidoreductase
MQALGYGTHIAIIGGLSGSANAMPLGSFIGSGTSVTGIYVGSREDFEAMNAVITEHRPWHTPTWLVGATSGKS